MGHLRTSILVGLSLVFGFSEVVHPAETPSATSNLKDQAQQLAIEMASEKAKADSAREKEAQKQLRLARERQVKYLYGRGLDLYRKGSYEDAIETLQRLESIQPEHDLVKSGKEIIAQAQSQLSKQAINVVQEAPKGEIDQLEELLANKRVEVETTVKYAKAALDQDNYDMAIELLQGALEKEPNYRSAIELLEKAKMAKLKEEEQRLAGKVGLDEQRMVNQVLNAELLNHSNGFLSLHKSELELEKANKAKVLAKLQEPVSFDFKDVALTDVIEFLSDAANVSIIPSAQLSLAGRRVSLKVNKAPLEVAIKALVKSQGLAYRIDDMAIVIATPEEFSSEPMETKVFKLNTGLGPYALEASAVEANPAIKMDPIKTLIEQAIPQPSGSKLVIDQRSGMLIATNTKENLSLIEQLITRLDVAPIQVLIETRFIEVSLTEIQQLGLESVLTEGAALNKKSAGDGTKGAGHELADGGGFKFPALDREDEGLNFTIEGVLTGTKFETVLHMLEENQKSKTLSAPSITALNNQTATIKVVDEFNYPTKYEVTLVQFDVNGDGDFDDANETEFVNVPKDFQKRDIGILLHVTPSIGKNRDAITLVLSPEVSNFTEFRDLGGNVSVPQFTSSQLTTSITIQNGQTIVLGGLMQDSDSKQLDKIPVLGDLPLVGGLFRQKGSDKTRRNLLIFITARILPPKGASTI